MPSATGRRCMAALRWCRSPGTLLTGAESLRDVITFPKTQHGTDLMSECPTEVPQRQLDDLFIAFASPAK